MHGKKIDGKVTEKYNCFSNVFENGDIAHFLFMLCLRNRVINVTFCYIADKLGVRKKPFFISENEYFKMMNNYSLL